MRMCYHPRVRNGGKNYGVTSRRVSKAQRVSRALRMKCAGFTDNEIISRIDDYQSFPNPIRRLNTDLQRALEAAVTYPARQLIALQYSRYEHLLRAVYSAACRGDLDAHKQALATIRQQSDLMGLGKIGLAVDGGEVDSWLQEMLGELDDEMEEPDD